MVSATDKLVPPANAREVEAAARVFCESLPHAAEPYRRRNWGGSLHSLCSYQGKLKPSIAHFLVDWFTSPGDRVLDPMAGVGTIPLEARRLGRIGLANDLSPLADAISRAKLEPVSAAAIDQVFARLALYIDGGATLSELAATTDVEFGLNGPIHNYFHPDTLREILLARQFFLGDEEHDQPARDVVKANVLHILHGNRPYALSRRSHPVTPFAPSGEVEYRSLEAHLRRRLDRIVPDLLELGIGSLNGEAHLGDFRDLALEQPVDAVITSPPFAQSLRFWSSNWMRLWFAGWDPSDFDTQPKRYLESQQHKSFDVYREFAAATKRLLKPGGLLIMHLGETASGNMVEDVSPHIEDDFEVIFAGREGTENGESHGLTDKGATRAHWYVFARARS